VLTHKLDMQIKTLFLLKRQRKNGDFYGQQ
jgi:hypothetical protein